MIRISTVADDWVVKGFHIHIQGVEIAMRPDHRGGFVFKKVFRNTTDDQEAAAASVAYALLAEPVWRERFRAALERGRAYMLGVEGSLRGLARGRTLEFHFLRIALDRLEVP